MGASSSAAAAADEAKLSPTHNQAGSNCSKTQRSKRKDLSQERG